MKKSNFAALILGTIGVVCFSLGMCMCLLPEWGMFSQGILAGVIGLAVLLVTVAVWRKMEGKAPFRPSAKMVGSTLVGVLGALVLGVGICLCLVAGRFFLGVAVGLVGMILLLMLIPLTRGLHD